MNISGDSCSSPIRGRRHIFVAFRLCDNSNVSFPRPVLGQPGVTSNRQSKPSTGIPPAVAALAFRRVLHFGYPFTALSGRVFYPDGSRLPNADDSVCHRGRADSK